jgi:hypothetical protein
MRTYAAETLMGKHGSPTSEDAREASERARQRQVLALLRQLWLGLSTYRLYPENPRRPGFPEAVERVGNTAREALAAGLVDLEIRGDRFVLDGAPLPPDDTVDRLALVCFERRVERLTVVVAPDASDLERLYETLSRQPSELEAAGGAEEVLRATGVTSVSLSPIGPGAVEEADHVPEELTAAAGEGRLGADVLASELMVEDLGGSPMDQAETLLARIRRVLAESTPGSVPPIETHTAFHNLLNDLPDDVRRSLVQILVDRVGQDEVAGRLIGSMSNAGLTRALVDMGRGGEGDPVALARRLAAAGVRHVDIVDLTKALEAGQEDAGTIIAGLEQLGVDLGEGGASSPGASVLDVLSQYLTATAGDDVRSIQASIAAAGEEARDVHALAVADYLTLESDPERAGEALGIWSDELQEALRDRDEHAVASLLQPVRAALLAAGEERPALFDAYVRRALDPEVVLDVVIADASDERPRAGALFGPFEDRGVAVVFGLLADEEDRDRRAMLYSALRRMVPNHPRPLVARLSDGRWYVVRNAVTLLGAAGSPQVLPKLMEVARHPAEQVRREVPDAMAAAGGSAAAPHLVHLALEGEPDVRPLAVSSLGTLVGGEAGAGLVEVVRAARDRSIRMQALDLISQRGDAEALLGGLVGGGGPRLPWRIRRTARRLLAQARKGRR